MEIRDLILLQNEWWIEGEVKKDLALPYKRDIFKEVESLTNKRQITVLTGLRRVGKTTIFFQTIQKLISQGIKPKNILYFSFDDKVDNIKNIFDEYKKATGVNWKKERIYAFFDEIQKLENWGPKIKLFYDLYPNIKFFVSGSSSVDLEKEAISNLIGRYYLLRVEPLSLKEFYELKNNTKIDDFEILRDELYLSFFEYIKKPFPEIVFEDNERRIMEYLRENVVGKIIYRDLPRKFKNVNEDLLFSLIENFYQTPGMILNFDDLSKSLHISKKTLIKHIFYLEFSYLIRLLKNFRISTLSSSRKLKKIYPYHWSLIFGFCKNIEEGKLLEAITSSLIGSNYYWREKQKEIDFILKRDCIIPIEVKRKIETKEFEKILKMLGFNNAVLIHSEKIRKRVVKNSITIDFIPIFELAYFMDLNLR